MHYVTDADILNSQAIYTTKSLKDYSNERKVIQSEGLYGSLYYSTEYLPEGWSREPVKPFNDQELSDYLLANTVDSDPRVSKVISDHFWDF